MELKLQSKIPEADKVAKGANSCSGCSTPDLTPADVPRKSVEAG